GSSTDGTTDSTGDTGSTGNNESAEERTEEHPRGIDGENSPEKPPMATEASQEDRPFWKQLLTASDGPLLFVRELLLSLTIVAVIGLVLFAVSGVWPPMVAVESKSMEPHISKYDLVFVTETGRFAPPDANQQGLVMAETGSRSHESFGRRGSVIVYDVPGTPGSPIIHRVRFRVEQGENWFDEANPEAINAESCDELRHCPAEYAGYVTKGDNNERYDQANGIAPIVKPGWVEGVAQARVPYLGRLRLALLGTASTGLQPSGGVGAAIHGSVGVTG
ncbi:MAG: S26 family signal peptidase, partial [Haloarculaceae archaeon]